MPPTRTEVTKVAYASKEALLGAKDLSEKDVELPSVGLTVKVQALSALYSNQATSEAIKMIQGPRGEQTSTVDTAKLELVQALHGLVEPKLNSIEEAKVFATNCGPAFKEVIRVIDEISGVDKESIEDANARFQSVGDGAAGQENGRAKTAPGDG
jgi:hypothetical protein